MSEKFEIAYQSEPEPLDPGVYEAVLVAWEPYEYEWQGETQHKMRWTFALDQEDGQLVEGKTSRSGHHLSKGAKWIGALMGDWQGTAIVTADMIVGRECQVQLVNDDKGRTVVENVMPRTRRKNKAA